MRKKFNLRLIHPGKYLLGALAGIAFMMGTLFGAAKYALAYNWGIWGIMLAFGCSGIVAYFFLKRVAVYRAVVTVEERQLTVHRSDGALLLLIPYADVVTYGNSYVRTRSVLRFKMADGTRHKLVAEELLGNAGSFWGVVHTLDRVAEQYRSYLVESQRAADCPSSGLVPNELASRGYVPMVRERGFFKRRISTVLFIVLTCVVGVALLLGALSGRSIGPLLRLAILGWIIYLFAWLLGMDERRRYEEQEEG